MDIVLPFFFLNNYGKHIKQLNKLEKQCEDKNLISTVLSAFLFPVSSSQNSCRSPEKVGWCGWATYVHITCFCTTRAATYTCSAPSRQPRFDLTPGCLQIPPARVLAASGSDSAEAPGPSALPEFIAIRAPGVAGGCESAGICPCCKQARISWMICRVWQRWKSSSRKTHKISPMACQQRGYVDRVFWPG